MSELSRGSCFDFAGRSSKELHLHIVHDGGLFERQFGSSRSLDTEQIRSRSCPYHFNTDQDVLKGTMRIYSEIPWTLDHERAVCDFLYHDTHQEFISADNPDLIYRLMFVGEHTLHVGMRNMGWIELEYECDAPWAWSKPLVDKIPLTLEELARGYTFEIHNICNQKGYNPLEIELTLPDKGANFESAKVTLQNMNNQSETEAFEIGSSDLHPLRAGESICVSMGSQAITSSMDSFRHTACNRSFVTLDRGLNRLIVKCDGVLELSQPVARAMSPASSIRSFYIQPQIKASEESGNAYIIYVDGYNLYTVAGKLWLPCDEQRFVMAQDVPKRFVYAVLPFSGEYIDASTPLTLKEYKTNMGNQLETQEDGKPMLELLIGSMEYGEGFISYTEQQIKECAQTLVTKLWSKNPAEYIAQLEVRCQYPIIR